MPSFRPSVVINNHNYGRFLARAIESALGQTVPAEVVVVDDGSTDESREIIAAFGTSVISILQPNRGQGSAINAGFARSTGDVVFFLDSDDELLPGAVAAVLPSFEAGADHVQFRLAEIDSAGQLTGALIPRAGARLPSGRLAERAAACPLPNVPPTTGHSFRRHLLEQVLPMPEADWTIAADSYLVMSAFFRGDTLTVDETLARYRVHGSNNYFVSGLDGMRLRRILLHEERKFGIVQTESARLGIRADPSWLFRNSRYVDFRLFSLLNFPATHPYRDDTVASVITTARRASHGNPRGLLTRVTYLVVPLLPPWARRTIMSWKVVPGKRPWLVGFCARLANVQRRS